MSDSESVESTTKNVMECNLTPKTLLPALEHLLSSRDAAGQPKAQSAAMIWGAMGIGKTDIVRTIAELWRCRVVALHLPQFDPTDLKGIPVNTDGEVKWVPSSYLPQCTETRITDDTEHTTVKFRFPNARSVAVHILDQDGNEVVRYNDQMNGDINEINASVNINDTDMSNGSVTVHAKLEQGYTIRLIDKSILFLDELSAAVPDVQNAALQLCLDRRVGEYDVPPYVPIVAAGNRESDAAFVSPMSAPLANRFCHLRLTHSLEDWVEWALITAVHPTIVGYLQWRKQNLFKFDEGSQVEGDLGFPTPRSWAKLSTQMKSQSFKELPMQVQNAIISGYIGNAVAKDFIDYRKICELLPSIDDILQGKNPTIRGDLGVGEKYGLASSLCYGIKEYYDKYYDDSIDSNKQEQQCVEWKTASEEFCKFIDENLGKEMTMMCINMVSTHLGISMKRLRNNEYFTSFASRYRKLMHKVI